MYTWGMKLTNSSGSVITGLTARLVNDSNDITLTEIGSIGFIIRVMLFRKAFTNFMIIDQVHRLTPVFLFRLARLALMGLVISLTIH